MTRDELIELIADDAKITKTAADRALKSFCDHATAAMLAGESLQVKGFGTFRATVNSGTNLRNPRTGEPILRPTVRVGFKAGRPLRGSLEPLIDLHRRAAA